MSECDVCIGCDTGESFEWSSTEIRKARKPHKCCECGAEIKRGERYEHVVGMYEGNLCVYDTCALCVEVRTVFTCGEGWMFENLWSDMEEYAFDKLTTASKCFQELSPAAKAFTLDRWQKWKGLR